MHEQPETHNDPREGLRKALQGMLDTFNVPEVDPLQAFYAIEMARAALEAEATNNPQPNPTQPQAMSTEAMETQPNPTNPTPRETLAALIAAKGWTMDSSPIAKRSHDNGMSADAGHYAFTLRAGRHEYQGEYSVGVGILADWAGKHRPRGNDYPHAWDPKEFRAPCYRFGSRLSVHQVECLPAIRRAYRPDIVDVVGSILMDVAGWQPECTFREWLADCGMDWKDPADALECFEAIRAEAAFIFRALPNEAERAQWLEVAWGL